MIVLSYDFSMLVLLTLFCANLIVNLSIVYLFFMGFILLGLDFKLVKICSRQELWQLDQAGKIHVSSMWGFEIQLCQVVGDWLAGRPRRDFLFILALQIILIVIILACQAAKRFFCQNLWFSSLITHLMLSCICTLFSLTNPI